MEDMDFGFAKRNVLLGSVLIVEKYLVSSTALSMEAQLWRDHIMINWTNVVYANLCLLIRNILFVALAILEYVNLVLEVTINLLNINFILEMISFIIRK